MDNNINTPLIMDKRKTSEEIPFGQDVEEDEIARRSEFEAANVNETLDTRTTYTQEQV